MLPLKPVLLFAMVGLFNLSTAAPDSAGIVEMVNGLAYGGIPYGSVTGMVAKYPGNLAQQAEPRQLSGFRTVHPLAINSNFKASRLVEVQPQTVQIYNLPNVISSGVGTIGHVAY